MNDTLKHGFKLPPEQQAIRDKCFHPWGTFVEFPFEVHRHAKMLKKAAVWAFRGLVIVMMVLLSAPAFAESLHVLTAGGFDADADVSWPVVVAQEKGFFAKEGIQFKSVRTDKAMAGLIAGNFDVINAEAPATILAAEKGASVTVVYVLSERPSQYMVLRKPLTRPRELEGETIGVFQIRSMVQLFLKRYLQKKNVDLSKVSFRRTGGSRERLASLLAGQSSATLLSTTYAFRAHQEGLKIIASPADWDKIPWNAITFRKLWVEANPNIVVRYLKAIHRATLWLYESGNFDDALRTLTPLSKLDETTIRWALKHSIENRIFNQNKPDSESFQALSDWFLSEAILAKPFNATSILEAKYYDQAVK